MEKRRHALPEICVNAVRNCGPSAELVTVRVANSELWRVVAPATERCYRIFVSGPFGPAPASGYPVLIALDGNAFFLSIAEAVRLQTRPPHGQTPAVVVGIGYETDELFALDDRYFDYTRPTRAEELPRRRNGEAWPEFGGAEAFRSFILGELLPMVARRFSIDRRRAALFGHSLGGLFVLDTLFSAPTAFSHLIAGSPAVWWSNEAVFDAAERFATAPPPSASLLIGVGSDEVDEIVLGTRRLANRISETVSLPFRFRYEEIVGEEHVTVIPVLVTRMIRFWLGPPRRSNSSFNH